MNEKNLEMIIHTLRLRMRCYFKGSSTYRELKNAVDMLTAQCYRGRED